MTERRCHYCSRAAGDWNGPCPRSPDKLHWTAEEKIDALEQERERFVDRLRVANRLLLAGAATIAAVRTRGRRARRRAIAALPARPDDLDLETEAAKISDSVAVFTGDQSLPTGPTCDELEGRS